MIRTNLLAAIASLDFPLNLQQKETARVIKIQILF